MAITPEEDIAPTDELPAVHVVTPEEGRALFDAQARELFGISGEEFLRRLDAGEYDEIYDNPRHPLGMAIVALDMLRPFAR